MNRHDTAPQTHEHPLHMNSRGRRIVGVFAVGALIATGGLIESNKHTGDKPAKSLSDEQVFDSQITEAIEQGPLDTSSSLGVYKIGGERTATNAIIQEAATVGRTVNLNDSNDLISVTISANTFSEQHQPSYQPDDTFVLFEQDVNGDGKKELLAKSIDRTK